MQKKTNREQSKAGTKQNKKKVNQKQGEAGNKTKELDHHDREKKIDVKSAESLAVCFWVAQR